MSDVRPVRRALLTVYDKTGVVELGRALVELGATLVSSGGTAQTLSDAGLPVTPVEEVTAFPEMLGGRVKTLHPKIHGGLLADRRRTEHVEELAEHGIEPFDLLVSNLYPFRETVASGAGFEDVIEKIDIGGPAMVRAAAKNFASVGVVVDPARYGELVLELRREGGLTLETRRACATARTRTSEVGCTRRSAALACSVARTSCRARRCRSTTGWTWTRRTPWRRRFRRTQR